ncbi:MFS transporter [Nonomuraea ferruginea]
MYLGGVVAAMSFGKFSPVGPEVAAELGLSLSQLGWVISAVVGVGAAAGLPAGYLVRRIGAERSLVAGLALTAAASAASVAAPDFGWLLIARVAEGIGYLLIIITCPALVVRLATGRDRGTALSIWATFVPMGLGASTLAGGALASALGWRGWIALVAGLTLAMALVLWARLPRGPGRQAASPAPPGRGAVVAAGARRGLLPGHPGDPPGDRPAAHAPHRAAGLLGRRRGRPDLGDLRAQRDRRAGRGSAAPPGASRSAPWR